MKTRLFSIVDVPQRSPEWYEARLGRVTGSVAKDMLAQTAKKEWAAGRKNLAARLVLERITGKSGESDYQNGAMRDGIEREPLARNAYEARTGELVREAGFLRHVSMMAGASLDGYIGDFDKLVSIKCRQPAQHLEFFQTGTVPGDAITQLLHECWVTGAREADYVEFNPDFPEKAQLKIVPVTFTDAQVAAYEEQLTAFLYEVQTKEATLRRLMEAAA